MWLAMSSDGRSREVANGRDDPNRKGSLALSNAVKTLHPFHTVQIKAGDHVITESPRVGNPAGVMEVVPVAGVHGCQLHGGLWRGWFIGVPAR